MVYILCMVVLVFFAVIGVSSFIVSIKNPAYRLSARAELVISGLTAENAEAQIRAAAGICMRYGGIRLICVCESDEIREICERLRKEYSFIEIKQ